MPVDGYNLLTWSRVAAFRKCPRAHHYAYVVGVRPDRDAQPLRLGSAFHLGLDLLKAGQPVDEVVGRIRESYAEYPYWATDDELRYAWDIERETCVTMVTGYTWRWQNDYLRTIASELAFELPLHNPRTGRASRTFRLAGKLDGIAELPDGRLAVVESKTTSYAIDPDADFWRRLRIDGQISLYYLAARELGYNVSTVLYDVAKKPLLRPLRATPPDKRKYRADGALYANQRDRDETPDEYGGRCIADMYNNPDVYFARTEIPRLDGDLAEFRAELWHSAQQIRDAMRHGWRQRNTDGCVAPYRCQYFDACHAGINLEVDTPEGFRRVDYLHPELQRNGHEHNSSSAAENGAPTGTAAATAAAVG